MAEYLHHHFGTLDVPAFLTRPICLSGCADRNQLLTFKSLGRFPFVRFMKLLKKYLYERRFDNKSD